MDLKLTVKQSQTLSPQMVQSMKILQMGSQELVEYISEAVQENPVLEVTEPESAGEDFAALRKKLEWLRSFDRQERYERRQDSENESDPLANYGGAAAWEENLYVYLLSQLQALDLPEQVARAARVIVESLNGSGYLDEPLGDLAEEFRFRGEDMEEALRVVQSLEPAGVGARDLSECLCLQLERQQEDTALAEEIVRGYLDALAKNRCNLIAKELAVDVEAVRRACDRIRGLNPKPGAGFAAREQVNYVTPDLFVETFPDHFELTANDCFFPTLKLSSYYQGLMGETEDEEVKGYLTDKLRQAKWVVRSIEQRRSTLVNCAECILKRQEQFFRWGPGHLVPLGLSDVAAELGVHESTISRAVKDKYLQCSHGVYPLSYFFSRSLGGDASDDVVSPDAAKALLKKLVGEEDKRKPLSDQKLCDLMTEQGCPISRRTVAKYRDELGIRAAAGRKQYE